MVVLVLVIAREFVRRTPDEWAEQLQLLRCRLAQISGLPGAGNRVTDSMDDLDRQSQLLRTIALELARADYAEEWWTLAMHVYAAMIAAAALELPADLRARLDAAAGLLRVTAPNESRRQTDAPHTVSLSLARSRPPATEGALVRLRRQAK